MPERGTVSDLIAGETLALIHDAGVLANERVSDGVYRLILYAPDIVRAARPGHFVHLKLSHSTDPLLRRPFGIYGADLAAGTLEILYQVVGRGTKLLAGDRLGPVLSVLGPLGRGFTVPAPAAPVAVVAGGLGIAPLCFLLDELGAAGQDGVLFQGARTSDLILAGERVARTGFDRKTATDDGSAGFHGSVVELAAGELRRGRFSYVYAAGPALMLKALCKVMREAGVEGEVSLEQRMGCGVGACMCCSAAVHGYPRKYARVCADGPVFPAGEVVWE